MRPAMDGRWTRRDPAHPAQSRGGLRRFGRGAGMSGLREFPGAFEEVINSARTERDRPSCVNGNGDERGHGIGLADFFAYMPTHRYIFVPCRQLWPARSVNARLGSIEGIAANVWLD